MNIQRNQDGKPKNVCIPVAEKQQTQIQLNTAAPENESSTRQ